MLCARLQYGREHLVDCEEELMDDHMPGLVTDLLAIQNRFNQVVNMIDI